MLFLYFLFMVWLIIFKLNFSLTTIRSVREVNVIPFYYKNVIPGDIPLMEALFNLLVFLPFGFFLHNSFKENHLRNAVVIIGISLIFELLQYVFSIGATDITDVITNSVGGIVGLVIAMQIGKNDKN